MSSYSFSSPFDSPAHWPLGSSLEWNDDRIQHIRSFVEDVDLDETRFDLMMKEELSDHREGIVCTLIDFSCRLWTKKVQQAAPSSSICRTMTLIGNSDVSSGFVFSLELLQVFFDLILHRSARGSATQHSVPALAHGLTVGGIDRDMDTFHRMELLHVLIDVLVSLAPISLEFFPSAFPAVTVGNATLSYPLPLIKAAIDWLRNASDDHRENSSKLLKSVGLIPLYVLFTRWNDDLFKALLVPAPPAVKGDAGSAGATGESDRKKGFGRSFSHPLSGGEDNRRGHSHPHPLSALHGNGSSDDGGPVAVSIHSDASKAVVEMFKLQNSLAKLLKVLIYGTVIDNFTLVNADGTMAQRHPDFTTQHLQSLFLFGIRCAR